MKKSIKRILCGSLSLMMASSLVLEHTLRLNADTALPSSTVTTTAKFENVTGKYNTAELMASNFNPSVMQTADVSTPTYETRTVIVSLKGKAAVELAADSSVTEFIQTREGKEALANISKEQDAFLRALKKMGVEYTLERSYDTLINAVAIEVNTKHVSAIKRMDGVTGAVIATTYSEPKTYQTTSTKVVTNETDVYETGIYDSSLYNDKYGSGTVVAILDTGLDYTHSAFQNFLTPNVDVAWTEADVEEKLSNVTLTAESFSGEMKASDVYVSKKVPFAYDYADKETDVYPSYSNHGTHVAGIIGGYDPSGYTDKDGNPITDKEFVGVVPDAQLAIFKVFTDNLDDPDLGGAEAEDIIAALEDCVTLGVDVINMSLGTACGFTTTNDGDDEGELLDRVYNSIQDAGISLICAASNDYSSGYGGTFGTNLATNPDSGTVGSPSTFAGALSVASINGQQANYMIANNADEKNRTFVFYEESRDIDGNPFDFAKDMQSWYNKSEFEYVVVPGIGQSADYTSTIKSLFKDGNGKSLGRVALIKRGDTTFQEKVELAMKMGAIGVIVYNNVAGTIRMNLGEIDNPVPAVSISMNTGNQLVAGAKNRIGTLKLNDSYKAGPFMSEFSSWGPTHDLKLKPEITAHGGEITSAVPGGYGEQSGTSMASPNMAGFMAIVRSYIQKDLGITDPVEVNRLAMQLTMSTAGTVYDQDGLPYSPRKQGAGVAKLENIVGATKTSAYLSTDVEENDYRPKLELGDDPERTGVYEMRFKVTNFGNTSLKFSTAYECMTETLASDKLAVSEQAYILDDNAAGWKVDGKKIGSTFTVDPKTTSEISVRIELSDAEKAYIDRSFKNGMYVEGFLKLNSQDKKQCNLSIPFLGFYGDWEDAPMLDYSAFEVAESEQDGSIKEEDKIKESVWATLPYSTYYNEKYILPMGGYVYLLPEDAEPMYVDEDHCAVSRYNEYYGEGNTENYMTSTGIKALYAGLLRNARLVTYKMYNVETGELILEDEVNRVGKAYTGGGSPVPANVELNLNTEEYGLMANGQYRIDFEFFMDTPEDGEVAPEENTFSFSFTVDYEAPILENARVRYYNYKDGNKEKQRIYLDLDIYDNHYPQALMLCYPKVNANGETVLQLATDYPIPMRDAKKNTTNTISVEITDIYDYVCKQYGNQIYVQMDDYAVNSCLYRIELSKANNSAMPEGNQFELAEGEANLSLDMYETHKVALAFADSYTGGADLSNFLWTSKNPGIADVKNGEIVGISAGTTEIIVSNRNGSSRNIQVTVSNTQHSKLPSVPSISFGIIKSNYDALIKAAGTAEVKAGETFKLEVMPDPWYHPMNDMKFVWESSNTSVATVDDSGNVKTLKKGTAIITATVYKKVGADKWEKTLYSATVILRVQNEFTVSNYTLTDYNGVGGTVVIPTDMNIWYIGEEAFKDNNNIKKIIIPESVLQINARAFANCTALEEVYFVSDTKQAIATADLTLIYEQAFADCINLRKIDFSNVKTITIAADCFSGCTKLSEVVDMPSIGTMHHRAFAGTALESVDLTGLHMSGNNVFEGCKNLKTIKTGKFTAIGNYMFKDCTGLRNVITLSTPKIGDGAFYGCVNLKGVKLQSPAGEKLAFDIGASAFEYCGKNLGDNFTFTSANETIRSIGNRAFAGSTLKAIGDLKGLTTIGTDVFVGTNVTTFVINDNLDLESLRISGIPFSGMELRLGASKKYALENGILYSKDKTKVFLLSASVSGELVLPETVREISAYAFAESKVTKLTLSSKFEKIGEGAFANSALYEIDFNGAKITEIPAMAFAGSKIKSIELPTSVTKLGEEAFADSALSTFKASGLQEVADRAFAGCKAMRTITLTAGISKMGSSVFRDCTALETVTMPAVKELGDETFVGARSLKEVHFAENASTTGKWTFMDSPVKTVVLGEQVTKIDTGAFYGAKSLTEITLPKGVRTIGEYAFAECGALKTVDGLVNVKYFDAYSFYNAGLKELELRSALTIGTAAFAIVPVGGQTVSSYTTVNIPVVETIGQYAFLNGDMSTLRLTASVQEIGYGAFASARYLKTVRVDASDVFFTENNVLYRYIDKDAGTYELVLYPAARTATAEQGVKTYVIKEGTVRIMDWAFYELNANVLNKVILPYSVNAIGDSAFYSSGVTEYVFESIQAPVLETIYRQEVADSIKAQATETTAAFYKGYYYANFETELYNYSKYGTQKSQLIMSYPENGVGYNNHIYSLYFGEKRSLGVLVEDSTRACIQLIEGMPSAEEVKGWLQLSVDAANTALVKEFSETVKAARQYYNNASKNEQQFKFVTKEIEQKLLNVEKELRSVKEYFNIPIQIDSLEVAAESKHRSEYLVGGEFSMAGLVVTVIYDDFSMETVDETKLTLVNTGRLTKYDRFVTVEYEGYSVAVEITVVDPSENTPVTSDSSSSGNSSSVSDNASVKKFAFIVMGAILLIVGGIGVWMLYKRRPIHVYDEEEEYEEYEEVVEYEDVEVEEDEDGEYDEE